jgi:hypothetical protein
MSPPVYQDNTSIRDEERLFRRIPISQLVKDDDTNTVRVSTAAFRDEDLSVNIESELIDAGYTPEICLQNHCNHKLVSISARDARRLNQSLCYDPLPEDLSHGLVYGSKKSRQIQVGLCAAAIWVIPANAPRNEDIEAEKRLLGI